MRLYSEEDFRRRPHQIAPEILRADLTPLLLQLADMDVKLDDAPWFDTLPAEAIAHARELLIRLGAISENGRVTHLGQQMSAVPLHPRLSRFVLAAASHGAEGKLHELQRRLRKGVSLWRSGSEYTSFPTWIRSWQPSRQATSGDSGSRLQKLFHGRARANQSRMRWRKRCFTDIRIGWDAAAGIPCCSPPVDLHGSIARVS